MGTGYIKLWVMAALAAALLSGCSGSADKENADPQEKTDSIHAGGAAGTDEQKGENEEDREEEENPDYQVKYVEIREKEKARILDRLSKIMETCSPVYKEEKKGEGLNVTLEEKAVHRLVSLAAEGGEAVICGSRDENMRNYEGVEACLKKAKEGKKTETEFYCININGIFKYYKLEFEKGELYVTYASAMYGENQKAAVQQMEKVHVYEWDYTEKGWLMWEKALSRNQEMDMHIFYRILPLDDRCREIMERCILPVSYFGNNLFLTDWDAENYEDIELNDLFDSFYFMKTGKKPEKKDYPEGIPKKEFEGVVKTYLDIGTDEIERRASYQKETKTYPWLEITAWNRLPQLQPFPEVVRCAEKEKGVLQVYVEAVFVEEGTDCSFCHMVTVRKEKDGGYVYLGNQVDWDSVFRMPVYKARREFQ